MDVCNVFDFVVWLFGGFDVVIVGFMLFVVLFSCVFDIEFSVLEV